MILIIAIAAGAGVFAITAAAGLTALTAWERGGAIVASK